jgi:hypothetical protein
MFFVISVLKKQQTLFLGIGNYFIQKQYKTFGRLNLGSPEFLQIYISRVAYNSLTGEVFVADNKKHAIFSVNIQTKVIQELVNSGVGAVSAMGFGKFSHEKIQIFSNS